MEDCNAHTVSASSSPGIPKHEPVPVSTAFPPTPSGMEDCTAHIVSALSSPGIPKHEPIPASTASPPTPPGMEDCKYSLGFVFTRYPKTRACTSVNGIPPNTLRYPKTRACPGTTTIKAQDVRFRFASCMEDCTTRIVSASSSNSSPGIPKHEPVLASTASLTTPPGIPKHKPVPVPPPSKHKMFAFTSPAVSIGTYTHLAIPPACYPSRNISLLQHSLPRHIPPASYPSCMAFLSHDVPPTSNPTSSTPHATKSSSAAQQHLPSPQHLPLPQRLPSCPSPLVYGFGILSFVV
ncbi:hypothetical protein P692DRAFT_20880139 [Suillus brevipes Sb2]|nr:hypothetical protein P692DRAFT_20880139 [Suillus brevipes Sb2]